METPSFWAVIPASVRYDKKLRPNAKLLFAEITALTDKTGVCWASNEYFMKLYGIGDKTVSDLVKQLRDRGYIFTAIKKINNTNIRVITLDPRILDAVKNAKNGTLDFKGAENGTLKSAKNGGQNNIIINNTPYNPPEGDGASDDAKKRKEILSQPKHKPERFNKLWAVYPHKRRGNKQRAIAAWDRFHGSDDELDKIAAALEKQLKSEDWVNGIGIPHVSTYFNGARWLDAENLSEPDVSRLNHEDSAPPEVEATEDWS